MKQRTLILKCTYAVNNILLTFNLIDQFVPIPMVEIFCNEKHCCKATFCPLQLAFARTLHTFQGQTSGVNIGAPPNAVLVIICDPGDRTFEGNNPGLLYMAISRATTIGNGDPYKSAIYFTGNEMNMSRIMNLTLKTNGEKYAKVQLRDEWIK